MKKLIRSENAKTFITLVATVSCFALLAKTQAVSPPPDGGYPGGNTAEGQAALFSLTTGSFNTAVGYVSLRSDSAGSYNTAVGAGALLANIADENTASGFGALLSDTTGHENTADGALALFSNTTGDSNTALGDEALFGNTIGHDNTATGVQALDHNTSGNSNTATGVSALFSNTNGDNNTAVGFNSLATNTHGGFNTAIGQAALFSNTTGDSNTAIGNVTLLLTTGSFNIALGDGAGANVTTANNVICIGAAGANASDSCFIGNIFGATSSNGIGVLVNSNGRLGTMTSSKRFKRDIKPMDKASEALLALKPVTFRYNEEIDPDRKAQFGLVAEDVEKVNPDLIVRDRDGKPYSVRYDQVNAMLLNEFLKEHRTVQELKSDIAALTAAVKEQAAQIQKVSAKLEVNESRSRTVLNEP